MVNSTVRTNVQFKCSPFELFSLRESKALRMEEEKTPTGRHQNIKQAYRSLKLKPVTATEGDISVISLVILKFIILQRRNFSLKVKEL